MHDLTPPTETRARPAMTGEQITRMLEAAKQDSLLDRLARSAGWNIQKLIEEHKAEIKSTRERGIVCMMIHNPNCVKCETSPKMPEKSHCRECENRRARENYQRRKLKNGCGRKTCAA